MGDNKSVSYPIVLETQWGGGGGGGGRGGGGAPFI